MLENILMVTLLCQACQEQEAAYRQWLDYQTVAEGTVDSDLANSWGDPELAGRDFFVMQPASGETVYLRFIDSPRPLDYRPMSRLGWNAAELLVEDPDALATELAAGTEFRVLQEPAYLTEKRNIRAFQAAGPGNEVLYFTHIIDTTLTSLDFGKAATPVDRVFIAVLGTGDLETSRTFYQEALGMQPSPPVPYRVGLLSEAHGLPPETHHALSLMPLHGSSLIEMDQFPGTAAPLEAGGLPAGGIAMLTFTANAMPQSLEPLAATLGTTTFPYAGRQTATFEGPDGERIELVLQP